ncbi:hypothetical protein [Celeribacter neptunius]|uniref:Uncharacterized protein n=1 Tax=Celeribacter neptunius TaxID=588602 RepID=A0A1I3WBG9_9RHOB|nr:hypothetical protein [Celeribacter neptunius]SFK03791.1 hypothetical protein SAMN04487991_3626 [Celeribacter neptunius]
MDHSVLHRSDELAELLRDRLGVRLGEGFEAKVKHAGRRLPRWARRKSAVIVEAMALEAHPRLAQQVEHKKVDRAFKELRYFLERQDLKTRRKNRVLDLVTTIAFVIFVTVGLVLGVMVWRGLV